MYPVPLVALVNVWALPVYVLATHNAFVGITADLVTVTVYNLFAALLKFVVTAGVNDTVMVAKPSPAPVIVSACVTPAVVAVFVLLVGLIVATLVGLLDAAKVPVMLAALPLFTVAVNDNVPPFTTVPLLAFKVIVGVAFAILHTLLLLLVTLLPELH